MNNLKQSYAQTTAYCKYSTREEAEKEHEKVVKIYEFHNKVLELAVDGAEDVKKLNALMLSKCWKQKVPEKEQL